MGAETFIVTAKGKSPKHAFDKAHKQACYDYGHSGYTGSIAEKANFILIELPEDKIAEDYARELIEEPDERIDDKWGPAGCFSLGNDCYLFFGWASS